MYKESLLINETSNAKKLYHVDYKSTLFPKKQFPMEAEETFIPILETMRDIYSWQCLRLFRNDLLHILKSTQIMIAELGFYFEKQEINSSLW